MKTKLIEVENLEAETNELRCEGLRPSIDILLLELETPRGVEYDVGIFINGKDGFLDDESETYSEDQYDLAVERYNNLVEQFSE